MQIPRAVRRFDQYLWKQCIITKCLPGMIYRSADGRGIGKVATKKNEAKVFFRCEYVWW